MASNRQEHKKLKLETVMKRLITALFASALVASSPAWAGGGHGHGHGKHGDKHAEKHWKKEHKAWEKAHKHWAKHGRHHEHHVVTQHYYPAPAVVHYVEPVTYSPPPGVHVVFSFR
jgi:hypothetical protein